MIKFFRKIRYNLMVKNNTGKYLKYAMGEIILVVIGILIALQINNWNEERIKQNEIKGSLAQILNDLYQDKKELAFYYQLEKEHASFLKDVSENKVPPKGLESILQSLDHYMDITYTNNGYSGLKNSGKISNINNMKLRSSLTNYFEKTHEDLDAASQFAGVFTNNRVIPFAIENLRPDIDRKVSEKLLLEKLKTSDLRFLINYQISVKNYGIGQVKKALQNNLELVELIKAELGRNNE